MKNFAASLGSYRKPLRKVIRALASLKLAVVIILMLGIVTAWGTIVEAQYDSHAARKIVYDSIWMMTPMILLIICLTAVMIDRWPWQRRHVGFVCAHIGIIVLLFGSWVTQKFGVDGSVTIGIGDKQKNITVGETDLAVYSSYDGSQIKKISDHEVDFFSNPASKEPVVVSIPDGEIKIVDSYPYAVREQKFVAVEGDPNVGAAIRFQLQNANVNMTEWMLQPSKDAADTKDLGPAQVLLVSKFPRDFGGRNAIVLHPLNDEKIEYNIHSARTGAIKKGTVQAGEIIETGWMGLQFRLLKYMAHAKEEISYRALDKPTPITTPAIRVSYQRPGTDKPVLQWMGLNSLLKLFSADKVYIVSYMNRRLPMGFDMKLKEFKVGRYQGTMRAASYESLIDVPGVGERVISMNEPFKHAGFTFYQASFNSDANGKPVESILSVNRDPGRWLKYFGSLLIVFGAIHLFYMKRRAWMVKKPSTSATSGVT